MKKSTLLVILLIFAMSLAQAAKHPRYIFYFIGDGMGWNHVALTEAVDEVDHGFVPLGFSQFPFMGVVSTNAATRLTTDSAAAGTALATGKKTSIGTIGMDADRKNDLPSIALAAKNAGMKAGVVTSVSIDHATPASFFAHAAERGSSYDIAQWVPKAGLDLYAGSGLLDARDLYEDFAKLGYSVVRGVGADFSGAKKVLWTDELTRDNASLPYAIDAKDGALTLPYLTEQSIRFLDSKNGFFLMVEGGKIDWAAHSNDAATVIHEVRDFDQAIARAMEFYRAHPNETLIVVTADHETGGLALGIDSRGYETDLSLLLNQKISLEVLTKELSKTNSWIQAREVLASALGFWSTVPISAKQELKLLEAYETKPGSAAKLAVKILNEKAGVGWTTGSHTAAFVPVFAIGVGAESFAGCQDNTDIARKLGQLISGSK